ncbi:Polynucleotidyl transferase- ribonuclease H-like superfamily protein [Striga hermonthica]|uniref:Polynucleotidyl transferase- ribonuclease H-like superfamily protein n=1 Tax=Striga hermonthica TaxID=68872 RepID=A0A9N7NQX0_STRHE|nr:Polynucleotidyl transferase- ribonuclease H-like superfamily protein [Striga hermonthica]
MQEAFPQVEEGRSSVRNIAWTKPDEGFVKINTDGASRGNPGVAAAGGLIRDNAGQWLVGFMAHLGICSNTVAKLQAIRYLLELAWRYGYRRVVCEVDARLVLDFVATAETDIHPCGRLIEDIRELLKKRMGMSPATYAKGREFCG